MKKLFLIGGTMGVGKTSVCRELQTLLPDCVFLDGDWCWNMRPFRVTEETKRMVLENIRFLLNQFLGCSAYRNIVFCWVMHEQGIIDFILSGLELSGCEVVNLSLVCSSEALERRLRGDVERGVRQEEVIARSAARLPLYDVLKTEKLDVSQMTARQAAEMIAARFAG